MMFPVIHDPEPIDSLNQKFTIGEPKGSFEAKGVKEVNPFRHGFLGINKDTKTI